MKNSIIKGLVASSLLVSISSTILADTTEDLINALVLKNILTEDEAALLSRQNKGEGKTRSKNVAGKLSISK